MSFDNATKPKSGINQLCVALEGTMKTLFTAAAIVLIASGSAFAQTDSKSTTDKPAASGQGQQTDKMSPGTTGAMQNQSGGAATSPQDVQKQGGMGVTTDGDSGKAGKTMGGGNGEKPK